MKNLTPLPKTLLVYVDGSVVLDKGGAGAYIVTDLKGIQYLTGTLLVPSDSSVYVEEYTVLHVLRLLRNELDDLSSVQITVKSDNLNLVTFLTKMAISGFPVSEQYRIDIYNLLTEFKTYRVDWLPRNSTKEMRLCDGAASSCITLQSVDLLP